MKNFVKQNWYKMILASSFFMVSLGFLINSVSPLKASDNFSDFNQSQKLTVPNNSIDAVTVKLSEDQLSKIIPRNSEGNIVVQLSDKQLKMLSPSPVQAVNIEQIRGTSAAYETTSNGFLLGSSSALVVRTQ
jgi:hypothetical protein